MKEIKYNLLNEKKIECVLDNGLKVIVIPKKGFLKYFASFSTSFGAFDTEYISINSNEKVSIPHGVAHFLEHKMFEMKNGEDANSYFSDLGVDSNAFTDYNQTSYIISGTKNLEEAIEYLLDFVQEAHFTYENVEKEKGIIIQEYKMYNDMPGDVINKKLMQNMYANISYNEDVVGNIDEISSVTKEMLYDAYESFYHPSNMLFCLVGDVDPEKIIDLIKNNQKKKIFKSNNAFRKIVKIEDDEIIKPFEKVKFDLVQPKVCLGIKFPKKDYSGIENMKLEIKFKVLLEMLFGSMSDSYQEMLDKEYIGADYRYTVRLDNDSAYFKIGSDTKKPNEFIKYIKNIIQSINELQIKEEQFEKMKKAFWGSVLMSLNDVEYIGVSYPEYYFKNCDFFEAIEEIKTINLEDIYELKEYFDESKMSIVILEK